MHCYSINQQCRSDVSSPNKFSIPSSQERSTPRQERLYQKGEALLYLSTLLRPLLALFLPETCIPILEHPPSILVGFFDRFWWSIKVRTSRQFATPMINQTTEIFIFRLASRTQRTYALIQLTHVIVYFKVQKNICLFIYRNLFANSADFKICVISNFVNLHKIHRLFQDS